MANTVWNGSDKSANITLSGGNLTATASLSGGGVRAVDKQITGKFYWEITCTTFTSSTSSAGFVTAPFPVGNILSGNTGSCGVIRAGTIIVDGASSGATIGTVTSGSVVCVAVDLASRLVWFRLGAAGNWNGSASANPATGVGGLSFTFVGVGIPAFPWVALTNASDQATANFGDTAFTGTVPSGFTSGFTAGATVNTNALATQVAVEHFLTTSPDAQVTQVAVEHWINPAAPGLVTQVALEEWATTNPLGMVTQIAIEEWTSAAATYARPAHPSAVLSASRAGVGSVVISS